MQAVNQVIVPSLADVRPQRTLISEKPILVVPKLAKASSHGAAEKLKTRIVSETFVEGYMIAGNFDLILKISSLGEVDGFRSLTYHYCLGRRDGNPDQYIRFELDEQPFILDGRVSQYDDDSSRPTAQFGPWRLTFLNKLQSKCGAKWQYIQIGQAICKANQILDQSIALDPNNECLDPTRWIWWDIR